MGIDRPERISHYRIVEELGRGGMGVVYKAHDEKLDRPAALKVLRLELLEDEEHRERFLREARSAAAVTHPYIASIYDAGEADGTLFIAMEFVEGKTLRALLAKGPLPIAEAQQYATEIAEGLARAHQSRLVHRDMKPDNVMIATDGHAKILDFGLAKIVEKRDEAATVTLGKAEQAEVTTQGAILGTPAYMSPEQARGEPVDSRSDIFSFGSTLYEMVTGKAPFQRTTRTDTLASILRDEPLSPHDSNPVVSGELNRIISRCLHKKPEDRYNDTRDLVAALKHMLRDQASLPLRSSSPTAASSIAVLPFVDMSRDRDQEYFCDGIAEELINSFAKIRDIRVASRTSVFQFKARNVDIREIGKRLSVSTVLEGSVQKAGDRLRIAAQLINVADGYQPWSERYDREMKDIFDIQDEISASIVHSLKVTLSPEEAKGLRHVPTKNVEAYVLYLRGRSYFYRLHGQAFKFARDMFAQAVECDPNNSLAYSGIADCCSWLFMYFDGDPENLKQAMNASEKALELDPSSAEAHAARGQVASLNQLYQEAEQEFEKAIHLNPRAFEPYYYYARTCFMQGKLERAADLFERATRADPADYQTYFLLANTYEGLLCVVN